MTSLSYGYGGWVRVDDEDKLPGPLYLRFRSVGGALRVVELYLDGNEQPIDPETVRRLPLHRYEVLAQETKVGERHGGTGERWIRKNMSKAGVPLGPLASYLGWKAEDLLDSGAGGQTWVFQALVSQLSASGFPKVNRLRARRDVLPEVRLSQRPPEGVTNQFLEQVKAAWLSSVARGNPPTKALAEQAGVSEAAVRKWVYQARERGIMDRPSRKGRVV